MKKIIRVAIVTNIIPPYRRDYFRRIFDDEALEVTVYCQEHIPKMNITSIHREFGERIVTMRYVGASNEIFGWQIFPLSLLFNNFDVYFIYGNPRIISNVFISLLLRALGKKVVICGQLHTYGSRKIFENIRLAWWKMFRFIYLYNEEEIPKLKQKIGFSNKIMVGMNNGLDQDTINLAQANWPYERLITWQKEQMLYDRLVMLSCARLVEKNRFEWVIATLAELRVHKPNLLWCVIGSGPEKQSLQAKAEELGVSDSIHWVGPLYEEEQLAPWFMSAKIMVHPDAMGLSLIHAFAYGLPVVTHDNPAKHGPEFVALKSGVNGLTYRYGDQKSMCEVILDSLSHDVNLSNNARITAESRFNTRVMALRFREMCLLATQH
jgi:glycosyltransferase involved in cell wall biosynthesis